MFEAAPNTYSKSNFVPENTRPDLPAGSRAAKGSFAAIKGHPVHPMLVPIPIGAFLLLVVSDLVFLGTGDAFWARASVTLLIVGILGGLAAALIGAIDLMSIRAAQNRVGWLHAGGNSAALVLAIFNWNMRAADPAAGVLPWGLTLTLVMAVGLLVTGWAGGHLVYVYRVGIRPAEDTSHSS
ncbi:DUF2231 domain-containing protein [Afifella sp. JA880]|uniref:DUF2231 domain-containing protein n=1 Tax=Afifella sp. JA880 TaxID=2975280 RepID=UPI0021BA4BC7|nr:DUF2231 domain-containing protein [Afifella sp. JA880]MCT8268902.1 DUF2231 domain-containing protein [Afifella sp. JA880]